MGVTVIKGAPPYTTVINNGGTVIVSNVIGVRGPPGPGGGDAPAISADPENRARAGSDGGVFVPELAADPVAYYILAKG